MKHLLLITTIILFFSCKSKKENTNLIINCVEAKKENSNSPDKILIKTCHYNNFLFKTIGTADYKGRYSYNYYLFQIQNKDTLEINNSALFSHKAKELERVINQRLKFEYESNSKIEEISDCMKFIEFRNYKLNEFGISITDQNQMEFNLDYGIGSACFNVSSSSVIIEFSELEEYLK